MEPVAPNPPGVVPETLNAPGLTAEEPTGAVVLCYGSETVTVPATLASDL